MTGEIKRAWLSLGFIIAGVLGVGFLVGLKRIVEKGGGGVNFLIGILLLGCCVYLYSEVRVSLERERWQDWLDSGDRRN